MTGRLLRTRVVADQLGLSTETVLHYIRTGSLPAFRMPSGQLRIREDELDRWLAERATSRQGVSTAKPDAARDRRLTSLPSTAAQDKEA
jgi:excisionase family DNA binding protein